jgi:hypothetical protein
MVIIPCYRDRGTRILAATALFEHQGKMLRDVGDRVTSVGPREISRMFATMRKRSLVACKSYPTFGTPHSQRAGKGCLVSGFDGAIFYGRSETIER